MNSGGPDPAEKRPSGRMNDFERENQIIFAGLIKN